MQKPLAAQPSTTTNKQISRGGCADRASGLSSAATAMKGLTWASNSCRGALGDLANHWAFGLGRKGRGLTSAIRGCKRDMVVSTANQMKGELRYVDEACESL